jgi:hypothetical protein
MERHKGQVIPVEEERSFAYQSETAYPGASIKSAPSRRDQGEEGKKYTNYELCIHKQTDTAMSIELRKRRSGSDIVRQRKQHGKAIVEDVFVVTLDFAELCNRIFGPGCTLICQDEAFPESVRQAMREAYRQNP